MTSLITTDLHLTNNPRDADRWNLFPWLREKIEKHKVNHVFLLGDLTDEKDRHPARLVNRFVEEVSSLSVMCSVDIIQGNHDYVTEESPFFQFISELPRIRFHTKPALVNAVIGSVLLLPHSRNWEEGWKEAINPIPKYINYIFTHKTFNGALAENGQALKGASLSIFKGFKGKIYSGDIHVPQRLSESPYFEYVGAPYRVHFGDSFRPRVLLLQKDGAKDLHFPGKARELLVGRNLSDLQKADFVMGSQVKIRVTLKRSEYPEWAEMKRGIKALAKERGWELFGPELVPMKVKAKPEEDLDELQSSPEDEVREYAKRKKLEKSMLSQGLKFLEEAKSK